MIVIPGGGESGRQACVKKAEELNIFIQCHEQVREHVRVVAYDSRVNKHEKLDKRKEANIIVLTMDCLRTEVQESMAVAEMNPGGYETAHLLQGAFAAFVPVGATSNDKSWLRIFSNLAVRLSANIQWPRFEMRCAFHERHAFARKFVTGQHCKVEVMCAVCCCRL